MKEWEDLTLETAERFGGNLPHPDTSQAIGTVYARAPQAVTRAIDRVAHDYDQGTVRSPWGILRSRVQQLADDTPKHEAANDREQRIARAEQWIRTAGAHTTWTEVEAELFAPPDLTPPAEWLIELERDTRTKPGRPIYDQLLKATIVRTMTVGQEPVPDSATAGRLAEHDTPALRDRLRALHTEHRPAAEQLEQDAIERGIRYQADRKRLDALRKPLPPPDDRPLEIKDGIRIP